MDDRLTGITAGNTVDYSFDYDLWGYQTEVSVGTQSLAEYTYGTGENCGRVASVTFGNGQTITFSYDSYDNVTGISYDGGTTYSYTYTYSSTNGLTSLTDNISDQITCFTDTGYEIYTNPQTGQGVLLYSSSYDDDDNFVQTVNGYTYTFADGTAETTSEAETRRTTGLTVKRSTISSTDTSLALSTSTDFFGRPVNSTLGVKDGANILGSVAVDYTYQNSTGDRTTEYISSYKNIVTPTTGTATNLEYTYTYDANGNIVSDSLGGVLKHSYVYDEAGQLVRVNDAVQNRTFCYTYDNGGNLIYKKRYAYTTGTLGSVLQTMATYAYSDSNWKDSLTSFNSIPLSYDAIGNLTYFDGRSFTWSAGRQLEKYEISLYGYSIDYKYNADGLRTQKYIDDGYYSYTTYDYIWADGRLVSQTDGTDVLYFLYDSNDSPIGFVLNDAATYLYIKNLQGDITGIADENGAIIVNYTYDEWGKLLSLTDNSLDGIIGELNPLRYRGYYYDTETGYYYLQSRYYNPSWGRFINADDAQVLFATQGELLSTNLTAYCCNDAINSSDYKGYWGADVHYGRKYPDGAGNTHDGTYEWAILCWFNETQSDVIADENRKTDKLYNISTSWLTGMRYHFNMSSAGQDDSREKVAEERFNNAISLWTAASRKFQNDRNTILLWLRQKVALKELGIGLHPLQDIFAHGDFKPVNGNGLWHGSHYDDVLYDWGSNKTSFGSKLSEPGLRYNLTALISCLYLLAFRDSVGLPVPS